MSDRVVFTRRVIIEDAQGVGHPRYNDPSDVLASVVAGAMPEAKHARAFAQMLEKRLRLKRHDVGYHRERSNPTLVHHGIAQAAKFHILAGKLPIADLYTVSAQAAAKIAEDIASAIQEPVQLLDNSHGRGIPYSQPPSLAQHTRLRSRTGSTDFGAPRRNPTGGELAVGQNRRTFPGGESLRVLELKGARVKVRNLSRMDTYWTDSHDIKSTSKIVGRSNPRKRRGKASPSDWCAIDASDSYVWEGDGSMTRAEAVAEANTLTSERLGRTLHRPLRVLRVDERQAEMDARPRPNAGRSKRTRRNPDAPRVCACGDVTIPGSPKDGIWALSTGYDGFHHVTHCWYPEMRDSNGGRGTLYRKGHRPKGNTGPPAWLERALAARTVRDLDKLHLPAPNPGRSHYGPTPAVGSYFQRAAYPQHLARVTRIEAVRGDQPAVHFDIVTGRGQVMHSDVMSLGTFVAHYGALEPSSPYRETLPVAATRGRRNPRARRIYWHQMHGGLWTVYGRSEAGRTATTLHGSFPTETEAAAKAAELNAANPAGSWSVADAAGRVFWRGAATSHDEAMMFAERSQAGVSDPPEPWTATRTNPRGRSRANPAFRISGTLEASPLGGESMMAVAGGSVNVPASGDILDLDAVPVRRAPLALPPHVPARRARAPRAPRGRTFKQGDAVTVPYTGRASVFGRKVKKTSERAVVHGMSETPTGEVGVYVGIHRGKGWVHEVFPLRLVRKARRRDFRPPEARHGERLERLAKKWARDPDGLSSAIEAGHAEAERLYDEVRELGLGPQSIAQRARFHRVNTNNALLEAVARRLGAPSPWDETDVAVANPRRGSAELERAMETFEMWHEFPAEQLTRVKVHSRKMPGHLVQLGKVRRIDYDSSKWEGRLVTYTHKTKRPYPTLATDPEAKTVYLVGGNMKVTADGLVN